MQLQRTILWIVFGLSVVLLWDKWQVHIRPAVRPPAAPR